MVTRVQMAIETQRQIEVLQGKLVILVESMTPQQKAVWEKWLAHQNQMFAEKT